MSRSVLHRVAIVLLVVAFVFHNDFWLWSDSRFVLGLPVGMLYHVGLCFVAALIFAVLVRTGDESGDDVGEESPS